MGPAAQRGRQLADLLHEPHEGPLDPPGHVLLQVHLADELLEAGQSDSRLDALFFVRRAGGRISIHVGRLLASRSAGGLPSTRRKPCRPMASSPLRPPPPIACRPPPAMPEMPELLPWTCYAEQGAAVRRRQWKNRSTHGAAKSRPIALRQRSSNAPGDPGSGIITTVTRGRSPVTSEGCSGRCQPRRPEGVTNALESGGRIVIRVPHHSDRQHVGKRRRVDDRLESCPQLRLALRGQHLNPLECKCPMSAAKNLTSSVPSTTRRLGSLITTGGFAGAISEPPARSRWLRLASRCCTLRHGLCCPPAPGGAA